MELTTTNSGNKSAWVRAILCGIYAISPVDIIPDVIPVVGLADDILALTA